VEAQNLKPVERWFLKGRQMMEAGQLGNHKGQN